MLTPILDFAVYCYELLCMDVERTRSLWLTHDRELTPDEFTGLYDAAEAELSRETLHQLSDESRGMRRSMLQLGESLNLEPRLLRRWRESEAPGLQYRDVLDHLVDHLCATRGFRRLVPTAVAVRYGHEVLVA